MSVLVFFPFLTLLTLVFSIYLQSAERRLFTKRKTDLSSRTLTINNSANAPTSLLTLIKKGHDQNKIMYNNAVLAKVKNSSCMTSVVHLCCSWSQMDHFNFFSVKRAISLLLSTLVLYKANSPDIQHQGHQKQWTSLNVLTFKSLLGQFACAMNKHMILSL